jgi:hypothetical protein
MKMPIVTIPIGEGMRMIRPLASHDASADPAAMPIEKTAR